MLRTARALVLACLLALVAAGYARAQNSPTEFRGHHRQVFSVVVVRGLTLADLPELAPQGAVGLLVPNAGPRTSERDAFRGMVRGVLYNARVAPPTDPVLISVEKQDTIPQWGPVIVVGLPPQNTTANDRRYPVAVIGAGYHGVLESKLTRVPGLVSMADIARTALQSPHALRYHETANPVRTLDSLERQILVARASTMGGTVLVLSLLILFALFLPRGAPGALAAALAANLALGYVSAGDAEPRLALFGFCTVAGGILGARFLRGRVPLGLALVAVLVAYVVTMAVHPWALSLAPLGPELTSRFYGVSNLLETLLLVPALLGARLLGVRFGPLAFGVVAMLAFAAIVENRLGADGGGAIVLGIAYAVLAVRMAGAAWKLVVPALGAAAVLVFLLLNADAAGNQPDHLRGALHGGIESLAQVAVNRVPLAYARAIDQWYLVFPCLAGALLALLVLRTAASQHDRALVASLLAGLAASLLVNDSPGPVTLAGLAALLAVEGGALRRELVLPALRRTLRAPLAPAAADARTPFGR